MFVYIVLYMICISVTKNAVCYSLCYINQLFLKHILLFLYLFYNHFLFEFHVKHFMQKIISIVNQKGGVGKTTTSTNLATAFSATGYNVLLIDYDPQGNSSTGFGIDYQRRSNKTIYDVIMNNIDIEDVIMPSLIPNLDIITADFNLSATDVELANVNNREFVLRKSLEKIKKNYDFIIIDCQPSLGLLTVTALVASNSVIIPTQCEFFALEGLSLLLKTINLVKINLNESLNLDGIILTMYDRRNKLTELVEKDVRMYLDTQVYTTVIPRNIKLSEAPSHGKPSILYDIECSGSKAYLKVAREILEYFAKIYPTKYESNNTEILHSMRANNTKEQYYQIEDNTYV